MEVEIKHNFYRILFNVFFHTGILLLVVVELFSYNIYKDFSLNKLNLGFSYIAGILFFWGEVISIHIGQLA